MFLKNKSFLRDITLSVIFMLIALIVSLYSKESAFLLSLLISAIAYRKTNKDNLHNIYIDKLIALLFIFSIMDFNPKYGSVFSDSYFINLKLSDILEYKFIFVIKIFIVFMVFLIFDLKKLGFIKKLYISNIFFKIILSSYLNGLLVAVVSILILTQIRI